MPKTVADVYQSLGFKDPDLFMLERVVKNLTGTPGADAKQLLNDMYRGTGRTSHMIAKGLVEISEGYLVAFKTTPRNFQREIRRLAQDMAVVVGLDPERIISAEERSLRGRHNVILFQDGEPHVTGS